MSKSKKELEELKSKTSDPKLQALLDTAIQRAEFKEGVASQEVVANALTQLSKILATAQVSQSSGVDDAEVERIVKKELENAKIGLSNLDASVTQLLQGQTINATLTLVSNGQVTTNTSKIDPEFLSRPLTQLILSDCAASNNVYLFGGAGTGKTYTAGQIADLLGWELVEVNCNQFTSPLELLGGQTIAGYQEGKVSEAWGNKIDGQQKNGCVLLLDELPKIDPNTAGILNSALAKIKLTGKKSAITNGRNQKIEKGNILIIGTGNTKLNETSEDYEANFKQDLSLQDRFIASTYEIFVYYKTEVETNMKGFLFIWLYMYKVRKFIEDNKQSARAFVSIRIMENMRETYRVFRSVDMQLVTQGGESLIKNPKNLQQACESFFSLFPTNIADKMKVDTDYTGFKKTVAEKNAIPAGDNPATMNFDTPSETKVAIDIATKADKDRSKIYFA